MSKNFNK